MHFKILASALCGLLAMSGAASAEYLSGQVGDKRYAVHFPAGQRGPCKSIWEAYIKAPGHSAYAQTPNVYAAGSQAVFCGRAFNAPSQKAAEERALASCSSTGTKYKVKLSGRCEIYASK